MRAVGVSVLLVLLLGLGGCGGGESVGMPDVRSQQLDAAKRAIKDAGIDQEVEVDGGGAFGVVNESNWEVCDQSPPAGEGVSRAPRLVVARSCDEEGSEAPAGKATSASETRAARPVESSESAPEPVLTPGNSKELAALLKVSECDESIAAFASKYEAKTIKFNGSIVNMAPHGDASTRYDILVAPGGKGPESTSGPAFKFEDVNTFDLHLTGPEIPDAIGEGDRFRFKAKVGEYNADQCVLFLEPVATRPR